ncbi:MAG: OmpA family protein [Nitrospirae bacterium]|nr:OmpA family protein [Nitrospirota bacterium]
MGAPDTRIAPFCCNKPAALPYRTPVATTAVLASLVPSLVLFTITGCGSEQEITASVTSKSLDMSLVANEPEPTPPLTAEQVRDVFFPRNRYELSEDDRQVLSRYAEWLLANPDKHVIVEGHCDESGTNAYNILLGEKRARAVAQHLAQLGVGLDRLSTVSHGESQPVCTEKTEACDSQNRRVHILIQE